MSSLGKGVNDVVEFVLAGVVGFGLALYIAAVFQNALPNGTANNTIGSIISGAGAAVVNVFIPIIALVFVFLIYDLAKKRGLIGHGGKE